MAQKLQTKTKSKKDKELETAVEPTRQVEKDYRKQVKQDLKDGGDLLDEIDNLLEENAEEFVRNYTQKGGE